MVVAFSNDRGSIAAHTPLPWTPKERYTMEVRSLMLAAVLRCTRQVVREHHQDSNGIISLLYRTARFVCGLKCS